MRLQTVLILRSKKVSISLFKFAFLGGSIRSQSQRYWYWLSLTAAWQVLAAYELELLLLCCSYGRVVQSTRMRRCS